MQKQSYLASEALHEEKSCDALVSQSKDDQNNNDEEEICANGFNMSGLKFRALHSKRPLSFNSTVQEMPRTSECGRPLLTTIALPNQPSFKRNTEYVVKLLYCISQLEFYVMHQEDLRYDLFVRNIGS